MNDILVRLMDGAQIIDPASGAIMHVKRENFQKFAELIIRECAELTLSHRNDDYYNGWLDYRDEIKRHFGLQE